MQTMKRSRSEGEPDGAPPPLKFSSAQVRLKGRAWSKHPYYYFPDGSIMLLVDATAYRIHGSVLIAHSPYWRDALGEPKENYEPQVLDGIQWHEMDAFLSVMYPRSFEQHELTSAEDWTSVLRLSSLWGIASMRSLAVSKLDSVASPLSKLVLARALHILEWLDPAFDALARRVEPLSLEEAGALTMEDVLRISIERENLLRAQAAQQATLSAHARPRNTSPAPVRRRSKSSSGSSRTAALPSKPSLPEITVPFSRKELGSLSTMLSKGYQSDEVLAMVTPEKLPAFCHAMADFSDLLSPSSIRYTSFSRSLFKRTATKPQFIPIAIKLASFIVSHNEHTGSEHASASYLYGFRRCLQDDVNGLRSLWASVNQAKIKYPDFNLAYKSGARGHYFSETLLGLERGSKPPREREYEERSANLRRFIAALAADNLVK